MLIAKDYNDKDKIPKSIYVTDFDKNSLRMFNEDLNKCLSTNQGIIPIYIDSYGGDVSVVFAMIDIINSVKDNLIIATIANGVAQSAGSLLLTSGSKGYRYAGSLTEIMIHDIAGGAWGKIEKLENETKSSRLIADRLYRQYDINCGQKKGYFKKLIQEQRNLELYLSPTRAKELGMIDYIKIPIFDYKIITRYECNIY